MIEKSIKDCVVKKSMESLVSNSSIRVLVVPFGQISSFAFKHYFTSLCKLSTVSLQQVTPFSGYSASTSALKYQNWQEGYLRFNFVVQPEEEEENQTLSHLGWHNLQAHKRCVAILGICDCPSNSDLKKALAEFQELVSRYPGTTVSRWCAFGITDDQLQEQDNLKELLANGMEIFPPEKQLDDGRSSYDFHMEVVLTNLSTDVLQRFEAIVKEGIDRVSSLENGASASSTTIGRPRADSYIDMLTNGATYPGDEAVASKLSESKLKKRQIGRLQAWIGGYSLLAGSPQDALNSFNQAIVNCSAVGDIAWQGVALEGSACALFMLNRKPEDHTNSSSKAMMTDPVESFGALVEMIPDVKNALSKAASLYSQVSGFWPLEAQVLLKLATYSSACNPGSMDETFEILSNLFKKANVELRSSRSNNMKPYDIPKHLEGEARNEYIYNYMEKQQKAAEKLFRNVCIQGAILFEKFKFSRKASYYLREASTHDGNWSDALELLQIGAKRLGIEQVYSTKEENDVFIENTTTNSSKSKDNNKDKDKTKEGTWKVIKESMLQNLVEAAQSAGKNQLAIDYALQLMKLIENNPQRQLELCEIITSCVRVGGYCYLSNPCSFPVIDNIHVMDVPKHLVLHRRKLTRSGSMAIPQNSPNGFFYNPFENDTGFGASDGAFPKTEDWNPTKKWVQNEISSMVVTVSNPTSFQVRVESIYLDIQPFREINNDNDNNNNNNPPLLTEWGSVECHRTAFTLKPHATNHPVTLSARPLLAGRYELRGCVVSALGLKSKHPIKTPVQIEVVHAMPCVSIYHLTYRQMVSSRKRVELLEGENLDIQCEIQSTSGVQVGLCKVDALVSFEAPSAPTYKTTPMIDTYDSNHLQTFIDIIQKRYDRDEGNNEGEEQVEEEPEEEQNYLLTMSTSNRSHVEKVKQVVKGLDEANEKLENLLQTLVGRNQVSIPLRFNLNLVARRGCKNATVQVSYSAENLHFERHTTMSFDIDVSPSLQILFLDVWPISDSSYKQVLFQIDLLNHADVGLSVYAKPKQNCINRLVSSDKIEIQPQCTKRLTFRMSKENAMDEIEDLVEWINDKVFLEWVCIGETSRKGGIELLQGKFKIPAGAIDRLNAGILNLDISSDKLKNKVIIKISNKSNSSEVELNKLEITICTQPESFEGELVWNGCLTFPLQKLGPKQSTESCISYKVVSCSEKQKSIDLIVRVQEISGKLRSWTKLHSIEII